MNKDSILVSFGQKIQHLRKAQGLSQEEFAFRVGVHRAYIGMIERGEKNITLSNIHKIANACGITISELFKDI